MPNPTLDKINVNGTTYDITDTTSGFMTNLVTLTYGTSTWNDFITAYNAKKIVYCHVSGRMAFMAYVNNSGNNPTEVEFQYYRSRNGHTDNYQGDQVYVYKLTSAGTWTTTIRNVYTKIDTEKGLADTYSTGTVDSVSGQGILKIKANLRSETKLTNDSASATEVSGRVYPVALDKTGYLAVNVPWTDSLPSVTSADNGKILQVVNGAWALVDPTPVVASYSIEASFPYIVSVTTNGTHGDSAGIIYEANEGDTVTVELLSYRYIPTFSRDDTGDALTITTVTTNVYSFTMPSSDVTLSADYDD